MESHYGIESINPVGRKPLIQGSASNYLSILLGLGLSSLFIGAV
jgi:hypothetical protein